MIKQLLANRTTQIVLVFIVGCAVGAIFYPSSIKIKQVQKQDQLVIQQKTTENQQLQQQYTSQISTMESQYKQEESNYQSKIDSLSTQVSDLKSKKKMTYYKIVHPDGTVEIRETTDSETDDNTQISQEVQQEYDAKLAQATQTLSTQYQQQLATLQSSDQKKMQDYQDQITKLQSDSKVITNPKTTGFEVGVLSDGQYYGHITHTLFGPLFVGVHANVGPLTSGSTSVFSAGGGVGINF